MYVLHTHLMAVAIHHDIIQRLFLRPSVPVYSEVCCGYADVEEADTGRLRHKQLSADLTALIPVQTPGALCI